MWTIEMPLEPLVLVDFHATVESCLFGNERFRRAGLIPVTQFHFALGVATHRRYYRYRVTLSATHAIHAS